MSRRRFGPTAAAVAAAILVARVVLSATPGNSQRARLAEAYGQVPLAFEANIGQSDPHVAFLARGAGYALFLTPREAVLSLRPSASNKEPARPNRDRASTVLHLRCRGANPSPRVGGLDPRAARSHYFIGNDPSRWHTDVPHFGKVRYEDVYPGIDLVYYGRQHQLEFDFVVEPGADPRQIGLDFVGADSIETDARGDLIIHIGEDTLRQQRPVVYQDRDGKRQLVAGAYVVETDRRVAFRLGDYDPSRPLVIDPVLAYSTYLGGSGSEGGNGIAVDGAGSAYVTGCTDSADFPAQGPYQTYQGAGDAFVAKLSPDGGSLVYATYLGGGGGECGRGIAIDDAGSAYVAGDTTSTDYPTQDPYQANQGGQDAFVTKLSPSGSALVYSTYLGGSGTDFGSDMAVDAEGSAYITGGTDSTDFPTQGPYQTDQGGRDAFVTKLSPSGASLAYSTYLGGSGDEGGNGIAVDGAGSAYVTGATTSTDYPTQGPYQTDQGGQDVFVTKLSPNGSSLVYSTYLGGDGPWEVGTGITVDAAGDAYVTGYTDSTDFPTQGPSQTYQGAGDAFVTKLAPNGDSLVYSTYVGGSGTDYGAGIAVDGAGSAYVTGDTTSTDFPTRDSYQADQGGGDGFVTKLAPSGGAFVYSTYLGGSLTDRGKRIAVDGSGNAYVTGYTLSPNFPTQGPFQADQGGQDAFVTKLVSIADVSITKTDGATMEVSGTPVTYTIVATNAGPSNAPSVTVVDAFPGICTGATWTCAGAGGGTCTASGSGDISDLANLPVGGSATYTATCTISASATGSLSNTATATVGGGVTDPAPGNNSATDTDTLAAGLISGTVTDAATGLPLANVQVSIYDSSSWVTSGSTDTSGVYITSAGLPAGTYYARTWNSLAYIDELYNNISCPGGSCSVTSGTPISVSLGTTTTGIAFDLALGGLISGTVTDAGTGLPLPSVPVYVYNSSGTYVTNGYTDSSGVYSSPAGLPAGTYHARTWNSQGYIDELYNNIPCPGGSCSETSGTPISVSLGTTTTGVDFGLARGGRISGTVTDAATGLPLLDVGVEIYNSSGNQMAYGYTDSSGVYISDGGLPTGTYYARTRNALGYVDELYNNISCPGSSCGVTGGTPISVTSGVTATGINFGLALGGRIGGTVTDVATGGPLSSVRVYVFNSSGSSMGSGYTDSSGVYTTATGLPAGTYYARTWNSLGYVEELYNNIPCPGGSCSVTSGTPISVTVGTTTTGVDFGLALGGRISGTVTDDATGLPLLYMRVDIYNSSGSYMTYGRTDSSGVYTSQSGLPTGTYYARTNSGYLDELYDNIPCPGGSCNVTSGTPIGVTVGTTTTGIDFGLAQGGRISGTVTDASTLPLAGVQVRIYNSSGSQVASANTNGSGVYTTTTGLPAGTYYARTSNSLGYADELYDNISCPGGVCTVTSGTPITVTEGATTTGIDFVLSQGGRISGTVTDATTGVPLGSVSVSIYNSSGSYVTYGRTDSSGAYTSQSGLPTGTYYARTANSLGYIEELYDDITCPGGSCSVTSGTPVSVTEGATTTGIDFSLAQGGRISGTVTDAGTTLPLSSVRVYVFNSSGSSMGSAYTDGSGVYTTGTGLPAGTYYARTSNSLGYIEELYDNISCPGGSCSVTVGTPISVTEGATTTGIDFRLTLGGQVSGTVTDAGTGSRLSGVRVYIFNSSGSSMGSGYTDGSGVYTTATGLPAGTYYARTWNSQGYVEELYNNVSCPSASCSVTSGTPISVSLGTTTTGINFGLWQGGRISGTVTDVATGLPLANVEVDIYNSSRGYVTGGYTNGAGVYSSSTGLLSGSYYAVTWNSLGYVDELYNNIWCPDPGSSCTVTSGTPIGVSLGTTTTGIGFGLAQGGRITGTVTDAVTGLPLSNVRVGIYDSSGSYVTYGYTDGSGVYTSYGGLPAGTYLATTSNSLGYVDELYDNQVCTGYACALTSGTAVPVTVGATTGGIDFALGPGGRVSGTVTDAGTGLPVGSVTVSIYNSSGTYVGLGSTDALGNFVSRGGLPTGTYYAKTSNSKGYVNELYNDLPCTGYGCTVTTGAPISVIEGATTSGINFALSPGGRVNGQVTDAASGLPVWGVLVHVLNAAGDQLASALTTSDGRYNVGPGLPTGSYYLLTTNSAGYVDELHNDVVCPSYLMLKEGIGLSGRRVPVPSCSLSSGAAVAVTVGSTTTVDFALAQGGRVSGFVTGAGAGVLAGVKVDVFGAAGQWLGAGETDVIGFYHTPAVAVGGYYLRTSNNGGWADELFDDIPCPNGSCSVTGGTAVSVSVGATSSGISFELTPQADVSITKTDGAIAAVPGTPVTYTIVATNAGPSNAPGVTVVDSFPGTCTGATWTCVGAGGGTCAAGGAGNISDTASLPAGGSATYTATCTISASATGSLSNAATVTPDAGVTDPTPANNTATDTDTLTAQADVSITKTDGATTEVPGTPVTYAIAVTNAGPSNAPGVTVADSFPGTCTGATWTCAGAGGGSCAGSGSGDINDTANLPVGASATYAATCTILASATGSLSNTATATAGASVTDPTPGNNTATDTDTLTAQADVSVTLGDAPDPVAGTGTLFYFVTATNAGPSAASSVSVVHALPVGVTFVSATGSGWSCGAGTGTVTCTLPSLSGTASFYVEVTVGPASGTLTSSVAVTATSSDPNTSNNSASEQTTVNGVPYADLSVALTDDGVTVLWGRPLTYTLTVTNGGPDAVTGATVSDTFPAGLGAVSWTCAASSGSSCAPAGSGSISDTAVNLVSGGTVTYSATGIVLHGTASPLVNTATVSSTTYDPIAANNQATVNTPVDVDLVFKDGFEGP